MAHRKSMRHFLDGYRKALIEFDMKKFGDDWHTAEDILYLLS